MELQEKIKTFPQTPGVYLMKDSAENIIYIGKSKHLRSRVQSYFRPSGQGSRKIENLVFHVKDVEYIETDTEFEALLLECQLIQQLKPSFNSLMKNPERYCYIVFSEEHKLPWMKIANTISEQDYLYFGPFSNKNTVEVAIQGLKEHFKIACLSFPRHKSNCLNYSLGQCIGICTGKNLAQYHKIIENIIDLFNGQNDTLLQELEMTMENFANTYAFEKAAKYRNYLLALRSILNQIKGIRFIDEAGAIVLFEKLDEKTVKFFLIKGNRILYRKKYTLSQSMEVAHMVDEWINHIKKAKYTPSLRLTKEEMDTARIIYHYLEKDECYYLQIPESSLQKGKFPNLERKLAEMIDSFIPT